MARIVATWFGAGLARKAPGTWGSLATLPLGILTLWLGGPWATAAAGLAATVIGLWAIEVYLQTAALKDPKEVVIDEVAGQLFALVPAGLDWRLWIIAFILFRFFDITKIGPIGWAERLPRAFGVMIDDVIAGIVAGLCLWAIARYLP
ncbi:MAG: phosphatidylglycerophosphatase A [Alphaproteobacteria bacterium]|nr:phosphatidylglycerophosphatase A [Alphaproteobacteria bacterium]